MYSKELPDPKVPSAFLLVHCALMVLMTMAVVFLYCGQCLGAEEGSPGSWYGEILREGLTAFFLSLGPGPRAVRGLVISHDHLEKDGETKSLNDKVLV